MTCESAGKECGIISDGCGGSLECGQCQDGYVCGGYGYTNVCMPACVQVGCQTNACGTHDDCGTQIECGECPEGYECAAANGLCVPIGCEPEGCGPGACGNHDDGCGNTMDCGGCVSPLSCGGGGTDGVCGCQGGETDEQICARLNKNCGRITANDCGVERVVDCGQCVAPAVCGAYAPNVCSCKPISCAEAGRCGQVPDGCGATLNCSCEAPNSCGGGGVADQCGCQPKTCAQLGLSCGEGYDDCGHMINCGACSGEPPRLRLRVMSGNISSGNRQSYDPGEGIRIFQGLRPDVVAIQEMNYGNNGAAAIRTFIESAFGGNYYHFREPTASIPNGVVSRYPIKASGEWDDTHAPNRDYVWAQIDLPGSKDLWVVSVHLLTSSGGDRAAEANQIVSYVGQHVPSSDYLVIAGDFNTGSRGETAIDILDSVVETSSPYPEDQSGNGNTNAKRLNPLDWLLADRDLHALKTATLVGSHSFSGGLVFDSRVFNPLSAVAPVLRNDSGAENMQHMGVVREFMIPRR